MITQIKKYLSANKTVLLIIAFITVSSLFWRFANYGERWTLSQDQARDAIIGSYMVQNLEIPFVGPPSSAGNFSFGPYYYWLIALFTLIIPLVNGPWIGFTLLSLLAPLLFFWIGFQYGGKFSALAFGLIAAFCSEFIFHSTDMLNPILISVIVAGIFAMVLKVVDQRIIRHSFWIGFLVGLAINFHLQALGLLIMIPIVSLMNQFKKREKLRVFGFSLFGLITSFVPLILFNVTHQNILFINVIHFIFGGQTSSGVTNNIITDIFIFWPKLWGETIAHIPLLGYIFILLIMFAGVFASGNAKNIKKSCYVIGITFLFQIIFLFIYQGVRSPIYLIVFHSFFVFFTGWIILNFYQFHKHAGSVLLALLLIATVPANLKIIRDNNSQISEIISVKKQIDEKTSLGKYILSDERSQMIGLPLYYLYSKEPSTHDWQTPIVACHNQLVKSSDGITEEWSCPMDIETVGEYEKYKVFEGRLLSPYQQEKFQPIQQKKIFDDLTSIYR